MTDTGRGIPIEDRDRLFLPFEQIGGATRRNKGGSGLGLSISKAFVDLHGGRMWYQSEPQSTTFSFALPIESTVSVESSLGRWFNPYTYYEEHVPPQPTRLEPVRPRLIVMERGDALHRLVRRYMGDLEAVPVHTLSEARQALDEGPAQALVVNAMNAQQTLERIQESNLLPYGTPAIVCSIGDRQEVVARMDVQGCLTKPVTHETLLEAVHEICPKPGSVLVVDDERDEQRLFQRMLSGNDERYRVIRAGDGREALAILAKQSMDLILLDLAMPGMDGHEFLEIRREDQALSAIPVLVVTAVDPLGQRIDCEMLSLARGGGFSVAQVLAAIQALTRIVGTPGQVADPVLPAAIPG